ncbi:hypothetical protein ACFOLC_15700 [Lysobacter cavernae]|uniref:Alpha/beta hydrolase n=1 Tax=Lysobacter cavernae TaxID=1685901 RepID=A0ABV7RW98_9GAMM
MAASSTVLAGSPRLIYLPSTEAGVDHAAIVEAFGDQGFDVSTHAYAGEDRRTYARRIAAEIKALMAQGVPAEEINVVGAGTGSAIATLASAAVGNAHVNYVLLGQCDPLLKHQYRFRMSGRVLGVRDDADTASHSCRPLWNESPRVSERQDLVLNTSYGADLFDAPRNEWLQPLLEWSGGGQVDVGEIKVTQVTAPKPERGH